MRYQSGRHFLQVPGPTNVPDRVLRAMTAPTIDHRGPEFRALARQLLADVRRLCGTARPVAIYPSSGTGAWEAALVNTLSPGERILAFETGHFATLWCQQARRLGLDVDFVPGDWRHGVPADQVLAKLAADPGHTIKAVTVVHNETSTGVTSPIPAIRAAMMLPPGLGLNAVSEKALEASRRARLPRSYWEWQPMLEAAKTGVFPYTPPTNLLYGLREALAMLGEEGLPAVFAGHARHAEATRRAVRGWGLEIVCQDPAGYSDTLTAVIVPDGHDADQVRAIILDRFNMSLGAGLGRLAGRVFRIGHLGDLGDLELAGVLCGVEMGLALAGVPATRDGVRAALGYLTATA
jgi:alanine-glyoxylate transaminase / serine-glyoxylate transaminase / serine-pyruvate transaminase